MRMSGERPLVRSTSKARVNSDDSIQSKCYVMNELVLGISDIQFCEEEPLIFVSRIALSASNRLFPSIFPLSYRYDFSLFIFVF